MSAKTLFSFFLVLGQASIQAAECPQIGCGLAPNWPVRYEVTPPLGETNVPGFDGTVVPGETYLFEIVSDCSETWPVPSTLSGFSSNWLSRSIDGIGIVSVEISVPHDITEPGWVTFGGFGGSSADCNRYNFNDTTATTLNLLPEGVATPTPIPTAVPTTTPTPCPDPFCGNTETWPPNNDTTVPTTVVIRHAGNPDSFNGRVLDYFGNFSVQGTRIDEYSYLLEDLRPDAWHVWYFRYEDICWGTVSCATYFKTAPLDAPTPTPSPKPSSTPKPTPAPTPSADEWFISQAH